MYQERLGGGKNIPPPPHHPFIHNPRLEGRVDYTLRSLSTSMHCAVAERSGTVHIYRRSWNSCRFGVTPVQHLTTTTTTTTTTGHRYDQRPHPSPRLVFWPVGGIEANKVYLSVQ